MHSRTQQLVHKSETHAKRIKWKEHQSSHSGKQTQALPRQQHQLPLHFVGASSYQYGKHLKFSYLHLTVAFFMLSNILKAS